MDRDTADAQREKNSILQKTAEKKIKWKIERRDTGRAHTHTTSTCNAHRTPKKKRNWKRKSER